jgi:hypothetical protein
MTPDQALTQETSNPEEDKFEEEWLVIMNTKGKYTLSKIQAQILAQAIAKGSRGIIMFKTFSIPIPYIAEFYQVRRFLKDALQLPAKAQEKEYVPISDERFAEIKKNAYEKIGKEIPGAKEK